MKTQIALLSLLAPALAFASSNAEEPAQTSSEFVAYISGRQAALTENDDHLFMGITDDAELIAEIAAESENCSSDDDFKAVSGEEWGSALMSELGDAYLRVGDMDDGYYSFMEGVDEAMQSFTADVLGKRQLEICSDYSVPAFSDGHEHTFLKADGLFVLMHEVGSPD